jgi:hypothetical protein
MLFPNIKITNPESSNGEKEGCRLGYPIFPLLYNDRILPMILQICIHYTKYIRYQLTKILVLTNIYIDAKINISFRGTIKV